ncbi:MAG: hypothetical protein LHV69_04410 [Elusimicrobia bacterium]|nr:hypothetical protein [Candidatus Obscuribacterium magneticum]
MANEEKPYEIVQLSSVKFLLSCALAAFLIFVFGRWLPLRPWVVATEVLTTIAALFILGSIRYRLDKNALTYGAILIIFATFWHIWWAGSPLRQAVQNEGLTAALAFAHRHFFSISGLEHIIHADTMLFILGLTFFVSVIAQTRLLETISFMVLRKTKGSLVMTVAAIAAVVSFASGILDGVSMIGLMIRTLVIILFLAKADEEAVIFSVIVSTAITTVCGMWLAYGEPPNLIMKANLYPHLTNLFFLTYCLPVAVGSYFIVLWNVQKRLKGRRVEMGTMDILDVHTADVRFLQAERHGEVLIPVEFIDRFEKVLGPRYRPIVQALHQGEALGTALVRTGVSEDLRKEILGQFVTEDLAEALDHHYRDRERGHFSIDEAHRRISLALENTLSRRRRAQHIGGLAFVPFIGYLIFHGMVHGFPLFWASFLGFFVAVAGVWTLPKIRRLALREAALEYGEYLFLFPLFFSITLLQKTGFFEVMSVLIQDGIKTLGASHVAYMQYTGAVILSAMLDNNVVADFASRALTHLDAGLITLFSMAQIAGYAAGGCWTHIGCAQSVVAYAFVRKEVNERYTPWQWIKAMTPVVVEISLFMIVVIYGIGWLFR